MQFDSNGDTPLVWLTKDGELACNVSGQPMRFLADMLLMIEGICVMHTTEDFNKIREHIQAACASHPMITRVVRDVATDKSGSICRN